MIIEHLFIKLIKLTDTTLKIIKKRYVPEEIKEEPAEIYHLDDFKKGKTYQYLIKYPGCTSCRAIFEIELFVKDQKDKLYQRT